MSVDSDTRLLSASVNMKAFEGEDSTSGEWLLGNNENITSSLWTMKKSAMETRNSLVHFPSDRETVRETDRQRQ